MSDRGSAVPVLLGIGLLAAAFASSSDRVAQPSFDPAPKPPLGGGKPKPKPTAPPSGTIAPTDVCFFNLEHYDASGTLLEVSETLFKGPRAQEEEARQIARAQVGSLPGSAGDKWVLVGVCTTSAGAKHYVVETVELLDEDR